MELKEKIAHKIFIGYSDGESTLLEIADAILSIPEIRDALRFVEGSPGFPPIKTPATSGE